MDNLPFYFSNKMILLSFVLITVFTEHVALLFPSLIFLCLYFYFFLKLGQWSWTWYCCGSLAKEGKDLSVLLMLPLLNILELYQSSCCSGVLNTALYSACWGDYHDNPWFILWFTVFWANVFILSRTTWVFVSQLSYSASPCTDTHFMGLQLTN